MEERLRSPPPLEGRHYRRAIREPHLIMGQTTSNAALRVIDSRFFDLFCDAIDRALEYVRLAETGKTHIGNYQNWPELRYHEENGLPWVSSSYYGPKNYADALNGLYSSLAVIGLREPSLDFAKERSFALLVDYARTQPRLSQYLGLEQDLGTSRLKSIVADALDRYIHRTHRKDLDRAELVPIYVPLEKCLFSPMLPVIAVVPILFLKFEVSQLQIGEGVSVEWLPDEFHLARGWRGFSGDTDDYMVESGATHGLFLRDISLENENWVQLGQTEMDPATYPVEKIDSFFAALRIATGYPTGYAQMVALPMGWASSYAADITPISGPRVEKYPPFFKEGYWGDDIPTVSLSEAEEAKELFNGLQKLLKTSTAAKIRIAMHRLNLSATRTTDEDGIIDSVTAMESLLSDDTQEMTHKVAMRLGALYKTFDRSRSVEAAAEMKRIYRFRSKVVHGSTDLDKDREIKRGEGKVATIDAALQHLRNAFATLIKNPALLDPRKIDDFLLTDRF